MPQVSGEGFFIIILQNNYFLQIITILLHEDRYMEDINLWVVLPTAFLALVIWVGSYVFIMLNVMRVDPREKQFRADSGQKDVLVL